MNNHRSGGVIVEKHDPYSRTSMVPVVSYDQGADVLYVSYTQEPADRGVEKDGIARRYKFNGELVGVTILDFAERLKAGAICA